MPTKTHDDEKKEERRRGEEEKRKAIERGNAGTKGREGREQQGVTVKK